LKSIASSSRRWDGQSWRVGIFAIWLTREQTNDHHKARRVSKTLYHSSWPYGLSSLLTDCIKSKHLDQRQKKNHNSKVWFVLYMQPKVFWSHTCPKPSNISSGVFCGKGSRRKNVIFTLTPWVLYKCYDLKPFWFPATFWEMSLH